MASGDDDLELFRARGLQVGGEAAHDGGLQAA